MIDRRSFAAFVLAALALLAGCAAKAHSASPALAPTLKPEPPRAAPLDICNDGPVDSVLVEKSARRLALLSRGRVVREYFIALGRDPEGPKRCAGDKKTPEGRYVLDARNPYSRAHKSIHISYPSDADRTAAAAQGCRPGNNIMIHGIHGKWHGVIPPDRPPDWTFGCIAVTDREMDEIWALVPLGAPIEIRP